MTLDICPTTDLHVAECDCKRHRPASREPGLYPNVPEAEYHGDKSALSNSGAKALLRDAPAQWIHDWHNPEPVEVNETMEFGSAVHSLILGVGAPVIEIHAETWNRKAEQEVRRKHRAAGEIPLLTKKYKRAVAMADAVRLHAVIGPRLETAQRELSGWFRDDETGVMCRFRVDALYTAPSGAALAFDVKTAETADPREFAASIRKFGYGQQDDWYTTGLAAAGVDAGFLLVVVGRRPPHLVSLNRVPGPWLAHGRALNRRAIDLYAECLAADHWPDYGTDIHEIDQPAWAYRED
ncbi:PD-(D/E)XK nuclease-like domain-containing protein [Nocardia wallacei]|uniref:PD-(D/E)XK nuclease-like domain-containing protein n=1 Tax=Nocardia wallacei TaxID=480035 RepID=UPI0024539ADE|nr:PD-(D/E)XK nuclease-like domain-containing protein [Nocardia wallacei]